MAITAYDTDQHSLPSLSEILQDHPGYLDEHISPIEAAAFVGSTENTLATLRSRGGGPRYFKRGSRISYSRRYLLEWIGPSRRTTSDEAA